jgi:hypothetical protein
MGQVGPVDVTLSKKFFYMGAVLFEAIWASSLPSSDAVTVTDNLYYMLLLLLHAFPLPSAVPRQRQPLHLHIVQVQGRIWPRPAAGVP